MKRIEVVEQVVTCTACGLHAQCTSPVPFRGDPGPIVVVGEAPGEQEDKLGRPFVGPAGQKLTELLAEAGVVANAYVNTASCFPHGTPDLEHVLACDHNKWTQIDHLNPTFLLLVGKVALHGMRRDVPLKRGRGRAFKIRDRVCFATYHPAAALRNSAYEMAMRSDLEIFAELVGAGPDAWMHYTGDTCAACPTEPVWYEADTGLPWCAVHLPSAEIPAFNARETQVAADRRAAEERRDEAVAAVAAAADPDWVTKAWETLVTYLKGHPEFFVDDFWSKTGLAEPREARALGPVVMRAAREGLMAKSGDFRKSVRSNMTEKPVWRSLVYVKP